MYIILDSFPELPYCQGCVQFTTNIVHDKASDMKSTVKTTKSLKGKETSILD